MQVCSMLLWRRLGKKIGHLPYLHEGQLMSIELRQPLPGTRFDFSEFDLQRVPAEANPRAKR